MAGFIAMMVLGAAFAVAGPFVVKYRVRLAKWQARKYREMGGWGAERSARGVTPRVMILIGCGYVVVGVGVFIGAGGSLIRMING